MGMRANAHLRKRGPEPKNAAVERREARTPRSQEECGTPRTRAGRLRQPLKGLRMPLRFSALRSPRLGEREGTAQASGATRAARTRPRV
jgi:hypothetical protein